MKTYRVVGGRKVDEHEPGTTFRAAIEPRREARLIRAGHLEVVPNAKPKKRKPAEPGAHKRTTEEGS